MPEHRLSLRLRQKHEEALSELTRYDNISASEFVRNLIEIAYNTFDDANKREVNVRNYVRSAVEFFQEIAHEADYAGVSVGQYLSYLKKTKAYMERSDIQVMKIPKTLMKETLDFVKEEGTYSGVDDLVRELLRKKLKEYKQQEIKN